MKHPDDNTKSSQLANAVNDLPRPRAEQVYYEHHKDKFWMQDDKARWIKYSRNALRTRLRLDHYLGAKSHDELPSEVDEEIDRIIRQQAVEAALPLAGYWAGLRNVLGVPVLVTDSPDPVEPLEGEHTRFLTRLRRMFGAEQADYFCGWLKYALHDYYEFLDDPAKEGVRNMGMSLVIAGSSGLGKSLLLKLITKCLGGRMAFPAQNAKGGTSFNNDLIGREVQAFDDEGMGDAYSARKEIGDFLKRMAAVEETRCHPKGRDAFTVRVFWRLIFSLNDEAENLQVLPPLERGVKDKVMMLKAEGSIFDEGEEHRDKNENWQMLRKEVAWFIHWLVNGHTVEQTLLHPRWGVRAWQHSDLVEAVDSFAPELKLLHMIHQRDEMFDIKGEWVGTARELEVLLKMENSVTEHEARDMLRSAGSTGKYLGKLADKKPEAVQKLKKDSKTKLREWRLLRPNRELPAVSQHPTT